MLFWYFDNKLHKLKRRNKTSQHLQPQLDKSSNPSSWFVLSSSVISSKSFASKMRAGINRNYIDFIWNRKNNSEYHSKRTFVAISIHFIPSLCSSSSFCLLAHELSPSSPIDRFFFDAENKWFWYGVTQYIFLSKPMIKNTLNLSQILRVFTAEVRRKK